MKRKRNRNFKGILYALLYNAKEAPLKRKYGARIVAKAHKFIKLADVKIYKPSEKIIDWKAEIHIELRDKLLNPKIQSLVGIK
jgi:hypothetical protein